MTATIPFLIVNGVTSFTSIRVVNLEVLGTALVRESETVLGRITIRPAAGTIALNIRNATNTVDVIYFSETGEGVVTGGIIAPSIGPAAGQKHTLPAVAADTIALLNAPQTLLNKTLGVTVLKDTDATPVADRQITVTDGLLRVRDMSGVEGRFISRLSLEPITDAEVNPAVVWPVNRIPNLDASKITTGRFPLARMPDAPANTVLKGSGIGLDPVYGKIVDADIDPNAAISKTKISTVGQWPITDIPVLTPDKYPDAVLRDGSRSFTGPPLLNFAGNTRIRFLSTDTGAVETVLGVESTSGLLKTFDSSLTEVRRISRLSLEPITDAEVAENASIAYSKLASLTPGSIPFIGADGKITQDNANLFWDNVNKRLGIGTNAPSERLHVIGNVRIDDAYKLTWSDVNLYRAGANLLKTDSSLAIGTLTTGSILFAGSNGVISQDNANLFWDNVNKRLGIGTNAPSYHLHVAGDVSFDGDIFYREKRPFGVVGNVLGRAAVSGSITANKGTNPEYSIIEGLVHYWYIANSDVVEPYPQITYDLGGIVYHIREVRVYSDWFSEYYPVDFKVEISSDGATWTTIANVVGNNRPFWSIKGIWNFRYLRITVTKANGSYDVHIKAAAYSTLGGSYGSFVFSNFTVAHWANINFLTFGYNQKDTNLYRGAPDQLKTDDSFVAMGNIGVGTGSPEFKLDARGDLGINRIANADSTNTLRNSFNLVLRGAYWNGSASVNRDAVIFHRMLSTTPTSEIAFQIAGADKAVLRDDGRLLKCIMNGLRNYSGTAKTVTETVLTLKDEVGPLTDRVSFLPLSIVYDASNPTGSGVTLTVVCRAVYTDGTTTDLRTDSVAAGNTLTVSFTPDGLYKLLTNGKVLQKIQLLAYCSATPAAGYEPTVTLTNVAGVSF